jgi:hypothetical protein
MGQPNRQGAKLRSVKSFPLSEGRKQSKGRKKKQRNMDSVKYPFHHLKESITVRMAKHDVSHRSA